MNRRGFLQAILAAGVAPAVIRSGILIPVRQIAVPLVPVLSGIALIHGALHPLFTGEIGHYDGITIHRTAGARDLANLQREINIRRSSVLAALARGRFKEHL